MKQVRERREIIQSKMKRVLQCWVGSDPYTPEAVPYMKFWLLSSSEARCASSKVVSSTGVASKWLSWSGDSWTWKIRVASVSVTIAVDWAATG